jgi:hypothetical protein
MQLLQPLAVQNVALSAGNILDMTGVDQSDFKAMTFKDFKDRNPVNAS